MALGYLKGFAQLVLALTLSAIVGCDRPTASSNATTQSAQAASEVRLGYFANVTHAQAVLGVHNGDYAKAIAPAKLSIKVFNAGPSLIEALFADEVDVAYV